MWHHWFQDIPLLLLLKELRICVGVFYPPDAFYLTLPCIMCSTASTTDSSGRFLPFGILHLLVLLLPFCHNLHLSGLPWELAVLPWRQQTFILRFKTQFQSNCSFESQSIREHYISPLFQTRTLVVMNVVSY